MHPLAAMVLTQVGSLAVNKFLEEIQGPSPYQQTIDQQAGMYQQMMPQLQKQAAGGMTPQLQGQFGQINRQVSQTQQTYGSQARAGSGTARTIPGRAQGARIAAAGVETKGQAIASSAQQAQNALLGIGQSAQQQQGLLEQQRSAKITQLLANIGTMYAEYKLMEQQGQINEYAKRNYELMNAWFKKELGIEMSGQPASGLSGQIPGSLSPVEPTLTKLPMRNINNPSSYWPGQFKVQ